MNPFDKPVISKIQIVPTDNRTECPVDNLTVQYNLEIKKMEKEIKSLSSTRRDQNIMRNETLTDGDKRKNAVVLRIMEKLRKKREKKIVL